MGLSSSQKEYEQKLREGLNWTLAQRQCSQRDQVAKILQFLLSAPSHEQADRSVLTPEDSNPYLVRELIRRSYENPGNRDSYSDV